MYRDYGNIGGNMKMYQIWYRYQGDTDYTYYDSFKTKAVADILAAHLAHSDKVCDIKIEEHEE